MIDTFAGGFIPSGVSAQNVPLGQMSGVTRDPSGNLVFCDDSNNIIRRINANGTMQTIAGTGVADFSGDGGPAVNAALAAPGFAKYDRAGNLYFADAGSYRIRRIDTSGIITTVAGTGISGTLGADGPATQAQIGLVTDLVIDAAGYVYFGEYGQAAIRRLTPSGRIEVYATCSACAMNDSPALALDPSGNLYVSDQSHIFRISPQGVIQNFAGFGPASTANMGNGGPALNAPPSSFMALAADSAGNLYTEEEYCPPVCNGEFIIRRIGSNGVINIVAGSISPAASSSTGPALQALLSLGSGFGLTADANGVVTFIDDLSLAQLTTQGTIQIIAGSLPLPAPNGTAALDAWFIQPNSIAFDTAGELYIGQNCIIQKIGSDGLITTIAGTGQCYTEPSGPALTTELTQVTSLAVDSHNQVYFGDIYGYIFMISTTGAITQVADINYAFGEGLKLAIDSQDRLYYGSSEVFGRVVPGTAPQLISSSYDAIGLAIDSADNVYVCCDNTDAIYRYSPNLVSTPLTIRGIGAYSDYGIAVDASSNIWQGETFIGLEKGALPFGCRGCSYGDGGPAESANLWPTAIAFAPNGDLYMLDANHGRVRRIYGSPPTVAPMISAGGIVNAASLAGGAIAPGELISIFGTNFGPPGLDVSSPQNNVVPKAQNNIHVYFGLGNEGAITARAATQINVFVPYDVSGDTSIQVIVDVDGVTSAPVTVPVAASAFGLSTANSSGSGQGAIFNQDGSYNSPSNPAARGSIVTLFGTGEGVTTPALPDGALEISTPYSTTQAPVAVTFGGQTGAIQYAGAAPLLPTGVFQINATVPAGVTPGDVSIGGIGTTRTVTVTVK